MADTESIEGVILAAGMSSRAGGFKPGLLIGGKPMIVRCIEGMSEVCGRIIVVGGYEIERLRELVRGLERVECIENPSYPKGMFTSVKAGLAVVHAKRCFLIPADIPLVPSSVYRSLLSCNGDIVVPAIQGRKGHPILLSRSVLPGIVCEPDDSSLREIIWAKGSQQVEVDSEEILIDIDTPEDYEAACRRFAR